MPRNAVRLGAALAALAAVAAWAAASAAPARELRLATTTSVRDSGLLGEILPAFRARTRIDVKVTALDGRGALELAQRGDADVVIAHDPDAEQTLVEEGALVARRPFVESFFVIAGPAGDPAHAKGAANAVEVIKRIAKAKARFVTRGDDSAAHQCERRLLGQAGLPLEPGWRGVLRTGAAMGPTLQVAGQKRAYVLADAAGFRAAHDRVGLVAFSGPDPALRDVYSVLLVPPDRFERGRIAADEARAFFTYLVEPATLERMGRFRQEASGPLFRPLP